jgi:hypothetical protein
MYPLKIDKVIRVSPDKEWLAETKIRGHTVWITCFNEDTCKRVRRSKDNTLWLLRLQSYWAYDWVFKFIVLDGWEKRLSRERPYIAHRAGAVHIRFDWKHCGFFMAKEEVFRDMEYEPVFLQ